MIVGIPITPEVVEIDPRYSDTDITPQILSKFTLESQSKYDTEATVNVNTMKKDYGTGASTLVRIYNATGMQLQYVDDHDWAGHIWKYSYDTSIENGQWSVFLHVHTAPGNWGSIGALIMRAADVRQDIFLGWESPKATKNTVYVEAQEATRGRP